MKIGRIFLLLIIFLFIGMSINTPSDNDFGNVNQKDLDDFENNIKNPDYQGNVIEIEPNSVGSCGRKVEDIIDSGFKYVFKFIKDFISDK